MLSQRKKFETFDFDAKSCSLTKMILSRIVLKFPLKDILFFFLSLSFSKFYSLKLVSSFFLPPPLSQTFTLSLSHSLSNALQLTQLYLETRVMLQAKPTTQLCILSWGHRIATDIMSDCCSGLDG